MMSAASPGPMFSGAGGVGTPSDSSCSSSRSAAAGSGRSWMRYSAGTLRSLSSRATASLAAIIRCSMSWWDSVCTEAADASTWPPRLKANSGSLDSTASAPAASRRSRSARDAARATASGVAHGSSGCSSPANRRSTRS
jgi:hypothetical protein